MNEGSAHEVIEADTLLGVVVVEPFPVMRAGLARAIDGEVGLEVVVQAGTADEAVAAVGAVPRERMIVLVGMGLPGDRDAYWLIRALRDRFSGLVILGVGANADPRVLSRALFAGADGFVDTSSEFEEFVAALRAAGSGETVIGGPAASSIGEIADGIERLGSVGLSLTRREREVLAVAAEGLTAREIAERLGVRERTVTTHLARIYGKLGVRTRVAAIRRAAHWDLVSTG